MLAGCVIPGASSLVVILTPTASAMPVQRPGATPNPELSCMIVNPTGEVTNVHDPTMIKAESPYYLVYHAYDASACRGAPLTHRIAEVGIKWMAPFALYRNREK